MGSFKEQGSFEESRRREPGGRCVCVLWCRHPSVFAHMCGTHIWSLQCISETCKPKHTPHTPTLTRVHISCEVRSYSISLRLPRVCPHRDRCSSANVLQWERAASCWSLGPVSEHCAFWRALWRSHLFSGSHGMQGRLP